MKGVGVLVVWGAGGLGCWGAAHSGPDLRLTNSSLTVGLGNPLTIN